MNASRVWSPFLRVSAMVGLGVTLSAQAPQSPGPPVEQGQVTFKVEINYVEVDAAVFDRDGRFVLDLRKEDFQVFEDGDRQEVASFGLVNLPVERIVADRPLFTPTAIPADVATNARRFEGRVYVLVMDDLQVKPSRTIRTRRAARRFIEQFMADNDLAAVVHTGGRVDAGQEFTSDKRALLAAVDKFIGRKMKSETEERLEQYGRDSVIPRPAPDGSMGQRVQDPSDMLRGYDARSSLEVVQRVAEAVENIRGRRKAVVLFSEGISYNVYDFTKRETTTILERTRELIASATRSNVAVYGIDPRGLEASPDELIEISGGFPDDPAYGLSPQSFDDERRLAHDSLRTISEETGGFAALNTNDFSQAFDRVVADNSAYYVLGYYPTNEKRDGRFRKIDVKVSRPGLEVRARRGYTAPRGKLPKGPKDAETPQGSPQIREALDSPVPLSQIRLRAFAAPFRGADKKASVLVTVEADGRDFEFVEKDGKWAGDFEVATRALGVKGWYGGDRSIVNFGLRPETRALIARSGVRASSRISLEPGRYQIRIATRFSPPGTANQPPGTDGGQAPVGRVGSVTYDVDIPDFSAEPLTMSGIVMTSAGSQSVQTVKADEEMKAVLPGQPTTLREFARGDQLAVFAEVYDNKAATPHKVEITTTILADDARVVFKTTEERASSELSGKTGGYGHVARPTLADLAPGLYVLRVEARTSLSGGTPVERQVQFRVR